MGHDDGSLSRDKVAEDHGGTSYRHRLITTLQTEAQSVQLHSPSDKDEHGNEMIFDEIKIARLWTVDDMHMECGFGITVFPQLGQACVHQGSALHFVQAELLLRADMGHSRCTINVAFRFFTKC